MTGDIVARRYAQALFSIGQEKGIKELDSYGATFDALGEMLGQSKDLELLFRAPVITPKEKFAVLSLILDNLKASPVMKDFCRLLAEKTRLPLLGDIAAAYGKLLDGAKGVVRGKVVTAVPLTQKRRGDVSKMLAQKADKQIKLGFEVDPGILGGAILQLGDTVMDASLKAQLSALIDTIKRGE